MDNAEIINNLIDKIASGENVDAKEDFETLISTKLNAAIELKKQEVAQSMYGTNQGQDTTNDETDTETATADQ